jgi:hypothetical protein
MEILIDKRVELITIIQTLCDYWDNLSIKLTNNSPFGCKYKENVKEYFGKYKNHEIVQLYKRLSNDITDISAFLNLALCYSYPPELNNIANYEDNFGKISCSIFPYETFISGLSKFCKDTGFEIFFKDNQREYENILNDFMEKNELNKISCSVSNYLSNEPENYIIILSSLIIGSFGIKIKTKENKTERYSIISPYDYKNNKYIFGNKESVKETLWHEIGHLTINDLTRKYIANLDTSGKKISEIFIENLYTNIETIVNEYIIRTITIRLFELNGEYEIIKSLIEWHKNRGFKNIETIKNYMVKNCETNNKLDKDYRYEDLIKYVINKI